MGTAEGSYPVLNKYCLPVSILYPSGETLASPAYSPRVYRGPLGPPRCFEEEEEEEGFILKGRKEERKEKKKKGDIYLYIYVQSPPGVSTASCV